MEREWAYDRVRWSVDGPGGDIPHLELEDTGRRQIELVDLAMAAHGSQNPNPNPRREFLEESTLEPKGLENFCAFCKGDEWSARHSEGDKSQLELGQKFVGGRFLKSWPF